MKAALRVLVLVLVAAPGFAQQAARPDVARPEAVRQDATRTDGARAGVAPVDAARLDAIVQPYVQDKTFMGTVLVARGADVLLSKGYGSANLEWNIPNAPSTRFRLGSITKQFTAASILLLEERGKLKLEDPIKTYLPDAPMAWDRITIFNLLTHTSGVPNFTSLPEYRTQQLSETPLAKTISIVRDRPLDFFPGEKMSYSNSGYILLGAVIEKVSGTSYERFLQDNIFTPLGMKDSGYDSNSAIIERRAAGYSPSPKGPINAGYIHMSIPHAAGALYSTTEDLLRWEQGLFGGKVVSPASLRKMTTPFKNDYAFGLVVQTKDGHTVVQHGGGIEGFNTFLAYYPDDKLTVVVLANINGNAPGAIAAKLATVAQGGTVTTTAERKEITLPASTLERYVGTYEVAPGINMWIRLNGDRLTTQLAGQSQLPIFPESETKFFLKVVDAQLEFVKDASGEVTGAVMHQNGNDLKVTRTNKTIVGVSQHTEITVPTATLSKYPGTYQFRPNIDLTVTLEGDKLSAQLTGQPKFAVFAESPTLFFYKVVDATLEFQLDGSGSVTGVRLRQGPLNEVLPRK
jgi:CubicO group peptidase (beta-lactamase class C family)